MHKQKKHLRVAVVGARGYSGLELARLLLRHPGVELAACFAHDSVFALSDYLPETAARQIPVLPLAELNAFLPNLDLVFLATPAEASLQLAPEILENPASHAGVIDLSGAFRLQAGADPAADYREWYQLAHHRVDLLGTATYGLVPFQREPAETRERAFVANPGCYATAALMALVPLLRAKVLLGNSIAIDAKSGTTGAGRKASEGLLFTEVEGDCLPYRVGKHQHLPEIREWAEALSGVAVDPFFATHLLPVRRGILCSLYGELAAGVGEAEVLQAYADAFRAYPLARFGAIGAPPGEQGLAPALALSLKRVVGTARVHLAFQVVGKKIYLFSLLDNLLKGAASQAVENMNRIFAFPLALGLEDLEGTL